jgi:hypothetical protein
MARFSIKKLLLLALAVGVQSASAFVLLGPYASWMDALKSYQQPGDIGGPMNLGEGYRWNMPAVTYGYDPSFVQYFGSNGIYAVEQAVKIINDLPAASLLDLSQYPTSVIRENYRASGLNLMDLKSTALSFLVEQLGLGETERFMWSLRDETHYQNTPYFLVVMRNYDPITFEPSAYVNGNLYTYSITHADTPQHVASTVPTPVNPLAPTLTTVADWGISVGQFYTGLSRDDVGGLRYLYRRQNGVVETLVNGATASANSSLSLGINGSSPWLPVDYATNITSVLTNLVAGGANTNAAVTTALRGGVEKVTLVRADYNMLVGTWTTQTNTYIDVYYSNNIARQQAIDRTLTRPDILFVAADLGLIGTPPSPVSVTRTAATAWVNDSALNNNANTQEGPGIIQSPINLIFSKLGPVLQNSNPNSVTQNSATFANFLWGSFDGSTNAPIVYPSGTSIRDLERQIFGN